MSNSDIMKYRIDNKGSWMSVFDSQGFDQHEQVSFFRDEETGLRAIIAVHNTHLGPSLGGCRMWKYDSEEEALTDVLRLSRGMTYKAAISGLPLGGGKSVIIGDARTDKTPELMQAMGRAVESLGGRYIAAEDVGMTVADMAAVHTQTQHVVGLPPDQNYGIGNPSPITAFGVFTGLQAAVKYRLDRGDLKGLKVAVQGLGNVGYNLCRHLVEAGAEIIVTDVYVPNVQRAVEDLGATAVAADEIYDADVDVFAPCALGGIINDDTLSRLKAAVIAGAANNQLAEDRHGQILREKKILYAPDYVINAGGLMCVYYELLSRTSGVPVGKPEIMQRVEKIAETVESVFLRSERDNIPTAAAADLIAERLFGKEDASQAA